MRRLIKFIWRFAFWALVFLAAWALLRKNDAQNAPRPEPLSQNEPPSALPSPVPRPPLREPPQPEAEHVKCADPDPSRAVDAVFVDKSERIIRLLSDDECLLEFDIALGFAPEGQKWQEGDGKTPTGEYTLDWRNPQSSYYRSIHISYPTPEQVQKARAENRDPGGDVMIHGQPNGSKWKGHQKIQEDWTFGCISVSNNEMDIIWERVANGTPITIVE